MALSYPSTKWKDPEGLECLHAIECHADSGSARCIAVGSGSDAHCGLDGAPGRVFRYFVSARVRHKNGTLCGRGGTWPAGQLSGTSDSKKE